MKVVIFLVLFAMAPSAYAADIGCGRDTDRSGVVDSWCPGSDADFDGFTAVQGDCDDAEWQIFPGTLTGKGCGAGQFRSCKRDGSGYGACTVLSSLSTSDIAITYGGTPLNIFWLAPGGTTGVSGGTYANPWDYRCISRYNGFTCARTPQSGDVYLFKAGNYTSTYTHDLVGRQIFLYFHDINSTNRLYLIGDPTGAAIITGQGVNIANSITAMDINLVSNVTLDNITVTGGYGGAVKYGESHDGEIQRLTVYDVDGNGGAGNHSGIGVTARSADGHYNVNVHHNLVFDNYNRANPTNANNAQIYFSEGIGDKANYNVTYTTISGGAGIGIKHKHGDQSGNGSWEVIGNYMRNFADVCMQFDDKNTTISHNLMEACDACFLYKDAGSNSPYYTNTLISYNTCKDSAVFLNWTPSNSPEAVGTPGLRVESNVWQDDTASYSCGGNGCPIYVCMYCPDVGGSTQEFAHGSYTEVILGSKLALANNCYYSSVSAAFKADVYGNAQYTSGDAKNNAYGAEYATWSAWAAAGYETNSHLENPLLNSIDQATSTNCASRGYITSAAPTTTTTTSSTTTTTIGFVAGGSSARRRLVR